MVSMFNLIEFSRELITIPRMPLEFGMRQREMHDCNHRSQKKSIHTGIALYLSYYSTSMFNQTQLTQKLSKALLSWIDGSPVGNHRIDENGTDKWMFLRGILIDFPPPCVLVVGVWFGVVMIMDQSCNYWFLRRCCC
jgi:hypothetical protein